MLSLLPISTIISAEKSLYTHTVFEFISLEMFNIARLKGKEAHTEVDTNLLLSQLSNIWGFIKIPEIYSSAATLDEKREGVFTFLFLLCLKCCICALKLSKSKK